MKKILLISGVLLALFTSCKNHSPDEDPQPAVVTGTPGTIEQLKDSVFLYAKEDYYWYDGLPDLATFKQTTFTGSTDLAILQAEVDKISQYKINPDTQKPYEYYPAAPGHAKYSFIDDGTTSAKLNAVSGDFGFAPTYYVTVDNLRVRYVNVGSPADLAGIKRGYQIISINGRTGADLYYDGTGTATNVNFLINAYTQASTINMVLKKPDGTTFTVNLNTASYKINPVITYKVLPQPNGKVLGYIVFSSFVNLTSTQAALDAAFSAFAAGGVTDLVVDFRYNGGGFVETAEYLCNLIAPASANGQLMYNTYYNPTLTANASVLLKNQVRRDDNGTLFNYAQVNRSVAANARKFAKKGSFNAASNVNNVFFIVTGSTASASELTINNLRPYMNVQLIGKTTYGKPVGFFDINIGKYQMYIPEAETKNALGQGGYYAGMEPASATYPGKIATDDLNKDFGDPTEGSLAQAINYVNKGVYITDTNLQIQDANSTSRKLTVNEQSSFLQQAEGKNFNGMILNKFVLNK